MIWNNVLLGIGTFLVAFLLFSVTVIVHELGHFLAARRKGLIIERFSVGFGPTIFSRTYNGVEYVLKALPFGGFVQLPQLAAMDMIEGKSDAPIEKLPPARPWSKIVAAFWGPLFSFLFAVVLSIMVWWVGVPQDQNYMTTVIGYVEPESPAAVAGLQPGDKILNIDGQHVSRWMGRSEAVVETVLLGINSDIVINIERDKELLTFTLQPRINPKMDGLRELGFEQYPSTSLIVGKVFDHSPVQRAGLQKGDQILQMNGETIYSVAEFKQLLQVAQGEVDLTYLHNGTEQTVKVAPAKTLNGGDLLLGIEWNMENIKIVHLTPWEQIGNSLAFIYKTLRALGSPKSSVGVRHLSGPIGIFDKIIALLQIDTRLVLYFTVMLNVNLAVVNLLPLPILDGGHILFSFIELVRRKTLSPALMHKVQMGFFFLLIGLFLFVTYHDIWRIRKRATTPPEPIIQEPQFAPSTPSPSTNSE